MSHSKTFAAALAALALAPAALAGKPPLKIVNGWSRPTPPGAPSAVGYLTIVNSDRTPDRLLRLDSPAATSVTVHSMSMAGGVMRMRAVEGGLAIPASGKVSLSPDGYHLMFEGLKRPFRIGDHIPLTLFFSKSGPVRAELAVQTAADDSMPGMDMSGGHGAGH